MRRKKLNLVTNSASSNNKFLIKWRIARLIQLLLSLFAFSCLFYVVSTMNTETFVCKERKSFFDSFLCLAFLSFFLLSKKKAAPFQSRSPVLPTPLKQAGEVIFLDSDDVNDEEYFWNVARCSFVWAARVELRSGESTNKSAKDAREELTTTLSLSLCCPQMECRPLMALK